MTPLRILQALPRGMRFAQGWSTSVELCVGEWVSGSRFRDTTSIVAERSDAPPLLPLNVLRLAPARRLRSVHLALSLRRLVRQTGADVILTQQHVETAGVIAALNPATPVVLQTHNFVEAPGRGAKAQLRNAVLAAALKRLSGITLISDVTCEQFGRDWPGIAVPRAVVTNGFDFSTWRRDATKQRRIMVVGRASDTKGILECAQAVRRCLVGRPGWSAAFVLSETHAFPDYTAAVQTELAAAGDAVTLYDSIPFAQVKTLIEESAISIVASKWIEPFGRTALEAHAAGAALVSSGTGGLRQISGDAAAYIDAVTAEGIAAVLGPLMDDAPRRQALGEAGADRVRRLFALAASHGGDSVSGRLDDFLESLVASRRGRHAA